MTALADGSVVTAETLRDGEDPLAPLEPVVIHVEVWHLARRGRQVLTLTPVQALAVEAVLRRELAGLAPGEDGWEDAGVTS